MAGALARLAGLENRVLDPKEREAPRTLHSERVQATRRGAGGTGAHDLEKASRCVDFSLSAAGVCVCVIFFLELLFTGTQKKFSCLPAAWPDELSNVLESSF